MPATKLGRINLLPKDSFEFSGLGRFLKWALTSGRMLVVLTEFVVILAFGSRFYYDKKLNDLIEVIDQKQNVVESYAEIENRMRDVLARQKTVTNFSTVNLAINDRFGQIRRITPTDVTYTEISINETGFNLAGTAGSEGGLANLLVGVNNVPNVSGVSIGSVEYDQRKGIINFKISVTTGKTT